MRGDGGKIIMEFLANKFWRIFKIIKIVRKVEADGIRDVACVQIVATIIFAFDNSNFLFLFLARIKAAVVPAGPLPIIV